MTYEFTREPKATPRSGRVTIESLNPEWVAALEAEWAAHQANPEVNHVVVLPENEVTRHASHARAWGMSREGEKVEVRKLPNRDGDTNGTLRISMAKHDENTVKKGRKPNADPTSKVAKDKAAA